MSSQTFDEAFVLAAGRGTRLGSVVEGLPKPLVSVQGEAILVRTVRWLARSGVERVWVNLHHRGDLIREALGDGRRWGVTISYSEEPVLLGTAGGVRKVLNELPDQFYVVYGDNLIELDLPAFGEAHHTRRADVSIAVFDDRVPNTGIAGGRVTLDEHDEVQAFTEGGSASGCSPFVNAGVYAVSRAVIADLPDGQFLDWGKDVFPALLARGKRLFGWQIDGYCLGFDTPASYERGLALIASGRVRLQ